MPYSSSESEGVFAGLDERRMYGDRDSIINITLCVGMDSMLQLGQGHESMSYEVVSGNDSIATITTDGLLHARSVGLAFIHLVDKDNDAYMIRVRVENCISCTPQWKALQATCVSRDQFLLQGTIDTNASNSATAYWFVNGDIVDTIMYDNTMEGKVETVLQLSDFDTPLTAEIRDSTPSFYMDPDPFISELHYDNIGTDVAEGVEITAPIHTDLSQYTLVFYNGANQSIYREVELSGVIENNDEACGSRSFMIPRIQNGPADAIALVDPWGEVVEFLSYEGSMTAIEGPATGLTSIDIGERESATTPIMTSLQLTDHGWVREEIASMGTVNDAWSCQNSTSCADTVTVEIPDDCSMLFACELKVDSFSTSCISDQQYVIDLKITYENPYSDIAEILINNNPVDTIAFATIPESGNISINAGLLGNASENMQLIIRDTATPEAIICADTVLYQEPDCLEVCSLAVQTPRIICTPDRQYYVALPLQAHHTQGDSCIVTVGSIFKDTVAYPEDGDSIHLVIDTTVTAGIAFDITVIDKISLEGIPPLRITEIHYDNSGADQNEAIEITGLAGVDLTGFYVLFYNGINGKVYDSLSLSGIIPDQYDGCGSIAFEVMGIQNGAPDGMALVAAGDSVLQFISYEGSFTAVEGAAKGMTSTDIGVSEGGSTTANQSLVNTGVEWVVANQSHFGEYNIGLNCDEFYYRPICVAEATVTAPRCPVFDLALKKSLPAEAPLYYEIGDTCIFDITVLNQGEIDAFDITIQDNVPAGLRQVPLSQVLWNDNTRLLDQLGAGDDTTVSIAFIIENTAPSAISNSAEIIFAATVAGGEMAWDEDSRLDSVGGGIENDNDIADDIMGLQDNPHDQDDYDIEVIRLCQFTGVTVPQVDDIYICDQSFDDTIRVAPQSIQRPVDLFFSEYIEGPPRQNNKCLEIYNGTIDTIDLSTYRIEIYSNGSNRVSRTMPLSGYIASEDVHIVCNNPTFTSEVDAHDFNRINFNGNDAVALVKDDSIIDLIGQIGQDPGSAWQNNDVSLRDQVLIRKPNVITGHINGTQAYDPASEWISLGSDNHHPDSLGSHRIIFPKIKHFNFYSQNPNINSSPLALDIDTFEWALSLDNSPLNIWLSAVDPSTGCETEVVQVQAAIHGAVSSVSCVGDVNLLLSPPCQLTLDPNSLYTGGAGDQALEVTVETLQGEIIDLTQSYQQRDSKLIYSVRDTCFNVVCWGYLNILNPDLPDAIYDRDTVFCGQSAEMITSLAEVKGAIANNCYADLIETSIDSFTSGNICDTIETTISFVGKFIIAQEEVQHKLYEHTRLEMPISFDSIRYPTSGDSTKLTIEIEACRDFVPLPDNIAHYWAEALDPGDRNKNGDQEGIPYAYPYLFLDSITVLDSIPIVTPRTRSKELRIWRDNRWVILQVEEEYQDTTYAYFPKVISNYTEIKEGIFCNLQVNYIDQHQDGCYDSSRIVRTWQVIDWCTKRRGAHLNAIEWKDTEPPVFDIQDSSLLVDIIEVQNPYGCGANFKIPDWVGLTDNCLARDALTLSYQLEDLENPLRITNHNDGTWVRDLTVGSHVLLVEASDHCGNTATHRMTIIVLDAATPIGICQYVNEELISDTIRTYLTEDYGLYDGGIARVPVSVFDFGSYDGCGEIILRQAIRQDFKTFCGDTSLQFVSMEYLEFCCEDLGKAIPIELTVFDNFGNSATCQTNLLIEGVPPPQISCRTITTDCQTPMREDIVTQLGMRHVVCGPIEITIDEPTGISAGDCHNTRDTIGIYYNGAKQCEVEIIYDIQRFSPQTIKWPKHYDGDKYQGVLHSCLTDTELDTCIVREKEHWVKMGNPLACGDTLHMSHPQWCESACQLVLYSYEDNYNITTRHCASGIRRHTIIDWCTFDVNAAPSQASHNDTWIAVQDSRHYRDDLSCVFRSAADEPPTVYFKYDNVAEDGYYTFDQIIRFQDSSMWQISPSDTTLSTSISGSVTTITGHPLENVEISIRDQGQTSTGVDGSYVFEALPMYEAYVVSAYKDDDVLQGVNILDLLLIQRHILGLDILENPYQKIAADVNGNGKVDLGDLVDLRRLLMGHYDHFPGNNSWRFIDADVAEDSIHAHTLTDAITCQLSHDSSGTDMNFMAIKIGDINLPYKTDSALYKTAQLIPKCRIVSSRKEVTKGEKVRIPIFYTGRETILGMQMDIEIRDAELIEIQSGSFQVHAERSNVLGRNIQRIIATNHGAFIDTLAPLFYLVLHAEQSQNIDQMWGLNESHLKPIAVTEDYRTRSVSLQFKSTPQRENTIPAPKLGRNYPNPFVQRTTIAFEIPKSGNVELSILNIRGKPLWSSTQYYAAGPQVYYFENDQLPAGHYWLQMRFDSYTLYQKLIKLR